MMSTAPRSKKRLEIPARCRAARRARSGCWSARASCAIASGCSDSSGSSTNSGPQRLQRPGELLGHRLVHPAVEVERRRRSRSRAPRQPLDRLIERFGAVEPARCPRCAFILTAGKPCSRRAWPRLGDIVRPIAADPGIDATRSRTLPPSSCQTGTPERLPLMSHRAWSMPDSADISTGPPR